MELRTLQYFLTVAQELNITHAARKLNISQPPLSRQLAQLESELGVTLFIRGKRKIQLTEEGKYLAQQAEHILNMANHTTQQLTQMGEQIVKGFLSIDVTETCSASILPDIIPTFQKRYPLISYDIWCGNSNDICQRLEQGIAEIGFIREPFNSSNFETVSLKKETWIAVVSKDHPLAAQTTIQLDELCEEPLFIPSRQPLQSEIHNWFLEISKPCHVFCLYNQISSIIPLIISNMGIAISPISVKRYTDNGKLAYLNIISPEYISYLSMIRKRHHVLPTNAQVFWDFVLEQNL